MGKEERSSWEKSSLPFIVIPASDKESRKHNYWAPDFPDETKLEPRGKFASSVTGAKWSSQQGVALVFFLWICKRKSQEVQLKEKVLLSFWGQPVGCKAHLPVNSKGGDFPYRMRLGYILQIPHLVLASHLMASFLKSSGLLVCSERRGNPGYL